MSDLVIGSYTETLPHVHGTSTGVLGAAWDAGTGAIGPVAPLAAVRNPSFVILSADGTAAYAVCETTEFEGQPGGGAAAFARDPGSGALRLLGTRSSGGVAPAHLTLDPSGRTLIVANYDSGSVLALTLAPDGSLGPVLDRVQHTLSQRDQIRARAVPAPPPGPGIDPGRQEGPHAHMATFDPVTGRLLVVDLGLDAVLCYELTADGLIPRPESHLALPDGSGPRHLAFHPDGEHAFLASELGSTVTTLRRAGDRFEIAQIIAAATREASPGAPRNAPAGIAVTGSGRHVLVSNRGEDTVAMFRFDPDPARLTLVAAGPALGRTPRDCCLAPGGRHLIVANTDSHTLGVLDVDEEAPALRPAGQVAAPSPSSVLVAPDPPA